MFDNVHRSILARERKKTLGKFKKKLTTILIPLLIGSSGLLIGTEPAMAEDNNKSKKEESHEDSEDDCGVDTPCARTHLDDVQAMRFFNHLVPRLRGFGFRT